MIKFNSYNIAPEEVEAIETGGSDRPDYPHRIVVTTKAGRRYIVDYTDEKRRNDVAARMVREVEVTRERERSPTMQEIRWAVQSEVDKLRPYLRRMEKALKAAGASDS